MRPGSWRDERGSALLTVVGVLTVLAVLMTGTLMVTQNNANLLRKRTDSMKAFYAAEAGLAVGESELLRDLETGASWTTDENVEGENAHRVTVPIACLQEVEPGLSELRVLVEVMDDVGVYKILSSATLSSGYDSTTAFLTKYVVVQDDVGSGGGVSPDLLEALNKSVVSGDNLTLLSHASIQGSAHSNGYVGMGSHATITLGYTECDDFIMALPTVDSIASYARAQAESVRSEYLGDWTSDSDSLTGNVHLTQDLSLSEHQTVDANLWIEGNLSVRSHAKVYGDVFVEGDLTLSSHTQICGHVFVEGSLSVGSHASIDGPLYVYGDPDEVGAVSISEHVSILSHVMTLSDLTIRSHSTVYGSLLSERSVNIHEHATVGTTSIGSLVYAGSNVTLRSHAKVYGSVIAHGFTEIREHAKVEQSDSGIDTSVFELFPAAGEPGIVDSYWGAWPE